MAVPLFDLCKDFLGATGPVLIAVPWFREFAAKLKRRELSKWGTKGALDAFRREMALEMDEELRSPRYRDLLWTLAGLACICASFVISFIENIGHVLH